MTPRLLDLFGGAGGAGRGYQQAGFHVTGVDIAPQPRYAGDDFHQADALTFPLHGYDAIHASPPCQAYSAGRARPKVPKPSPMLIAAARARLAAAGVPYVIENVTGARPHMIDPVMLCGAAFHLGAHCDDGAYRQLRRHRLFESNVLIMSPGCGCGSREKLGVYGNGGGWANRFSVRRKGYQGNKRERADAMGIGWMTTAEVAEAIPPAYTAHIGEYLLAAVLAQPSVRRPVAIEVPPVT